MTVRRPTAAVIQEAIEEDFQCHRCGECCKGDGAVRVDPAEADRMAIYLKLSRGAFLEEYAIEAGNEEWWLIDRDDEDGWCIFLERDDAGLYSCRVNPVKPDQCGSFPLKWRNDDSFRRCEGLKALMLRLKSGG